MIQLFKPQLGSEELQALAEIFEKGWIGLGPKTKEFEDKFSNFTGTKHCIGLNSCTAALDLAVRLLDIGRNDEVIVPTMTFVSTAHAVAYNLAQPVFADVEPDTLAIDPQDVLKKITRRTKAIIAVHYAGRPANLTKLKEVAGTIPIIEDCAHATGSYYQGKHVGTSGKLSCFSFHAVKNLAMGDGGALCLGDDELAERCRRLRWLGIDKDTWDRSRVDEKYWWEYFVDEIGLKCHMNDIQAAIGLVQLRKLEQMNKRRKELSELYFRNLANIKEIELPKQDDQDYKSSWHIFHIKCKNRNALANKLSENGIITGVHYKPIHLYSCYGNRATLPVAEEAFTKILSLPLHPGLQDEEVIEVCQRIRHFYE